MLEPAAFESTPSPKQGVLGLAGHVDHGKTALIEALTGMVTARAHERQLGMTQDLGFAHMSDAAGNTLGVIDVPGHERYIRNMVAGAWRLDITLLVVAANEGWMPMTAHHLDVVRAMGCERIVVCISKADLASEDEIAALEELLFEQVMERAGIVPEMAVVSALNQQGIEPLRQLLFAQLQQLEAADEQPPLLYVDRSFSVNGIGTVVTGTLAHGQINVGDTLLLQPSEQRVKVRSLQRYQQGQDSVSGSCRLAVGLKGVPRKQVQRGYCLSAPLAPQRLCRQLIVALDRPRTEGRRSLQVEVAIGTWHGLGQLVYIPDSQLARLTLTQPVSLAFAQRLALIRHGGSELLHGAQVAWTDEIPLHYRKRLYQLLRQQSQPLTQHHQGLLRLQLFGAIIAEQLPLEYRDQRMQQQGDILFLTDWLQQTSEALLALLRQPGAAYPLVQLATKMRLSETVVATVLDQLKAQELVRLSCDRWVHGGGHSEDDLPPEELQLLQQARQCGSQGLQLDKCSQRFSKQSVRNLARLNYVVVLDRTIVYDSELYLSLAKQVVGQQQPGDRLSMGEIKARTGLSRKYAIPLANKMEADGWVRRVDDVRVVMRLPQ